MFFKIADKKLADIGFQKIKENKFGVTYERYVREYGFVQKVCILHKQSGRHILQSYDPSLMDDKNIGCTSVGLTGYEMKLFLRKMREIGLYSCLSSMWHEDQRRMEGNNE